MIEVNTQAGSIGGVGVLRFAQDDKRFWVGRALCSG